MMIVAARTRPPPAARLAEMPARTVEAMISSSESSETPKPMPIQAASSS